jgi:tRNA-dihydrouridine synthase
LALEILAYLSYTSRLMKNIWQDLKKAKQPFFVLAPMDDVTDTVFRQIVAAHAPADLMMTEFANADGWCSPGKQAIGARLQHTKFEKPLIAQIWGITPEHYEQMAGDIVNMGFDGIDINMGCPIKDMIKKGACSAMIANPQLAREVILATQKGANGKIPVSVKTRIGYDKPDIEGWIGFLLEQKLSAISIHGRTKAEMSRVPAHWDEIKQAVKLRDKVSPETVIVGNGDVMSLEQGRELGRQSGVDGIMIGRGVFHNFFVFDESKTPSIENMLPILREHVLLHQETWGDAKFEPLKKFVKMYINGFANASELRATMMQTKTHGDLLEIIDKTDKNI